MANKFPNQLRQMRKRRGISISKMAELCGISKSAISRYERGERTPDLKEAEALADFFDISLDYLCGRKK